MFALSTTTLLSLALMTGNELCVAVFVEPVLRALPDAQQVSTVPLFAGRLGRFMPPWYATTLLMTGALTFVRFRHNRFPWNGAAVSLILQLLVLIVTLATLVPRNARLARMKAAYPTWLQDARQWDRLHQARVVLLLAASIALATF